MKKLLVTGASGFLGWSLCRSALENWEVHGLYSKNKVQIPGMSHYELDLRKFSAVSRFIENLAPSGVVHLAACSDPNYCELNPALSEEVNVACSLNLAEICKKNNIPMVFVSSDLVFNGEHPPYSEASPVSPLSRYGKQKVSVETELRKEGGGLAICRAPLMFGALGPFGKSFLQPMINSLLEKKPLVLFEDEIRTPLSSEWAGLALLGAVGREGLFHLPGPQAVSRVEMGLLLCDLLGADKGLVMRSRRKDVNMPAKRPRDVSLVSIHSKPLVKESPPLKNQLERVLLGQNFFGVG